jgi:hypothetical protein
MSGGGEAGESAAAARFRVVGMSADTDNPESIAVICRGEDAVERHGE